MNIFGIIGLCILGAFLLLLYAVYTQSVYQTIIKRDGCGIWFFDALVVIIRLAMNLGIAFGVYSYIQYIHKIPTYDSNSLVKGERYYSDNGDMICSGIYDHYINFTETTCQYRSKKCNVYMPQAHLDDNEKIVGKGTGDIDFSNPICNE